MLLRNETFKKIVAALQDAGHDDLIQEALKPISASETVWECGDLTCELECKVEALHLHYQKTTPCASLHDWSINSVGYLILWDNTGRIITSFRSSILDIEDEEEMLREVDAILEKRK